MSEQTIENIIIKTLGGDTQKKLLTFVAFLKANDMYFERGKGYWSNQLYYMIKYKNEYVCFILINGIGDERELSPLTIWTDDSGSNWFENFHLNEPEKEIAWNNVDYCANCGACGGGTHKCIFGKEFDNVCRTTMRFINPDDATLAFIKKIVELRKDDIIKRLYTK